MKIPFTKMHGLGNDFVIVEYIENIDFSELAKKMCDRHFGVGADGLIVVNPKDMKNNTDTSWRIFNSDGTEPQMCGNGIRCFARYVFDKKIVEKKEFSVNTLAGIVKPKILLDGKVKVNMGKPILDPLKIPFKGINPLGFEINAKDKYFIANAISMGNPHCVIFTEEDTKFLAQNYGACVEKNELFPEKTNVEFVKIYSRNYMKLDVWERGCGITLACGTGSCAAAVAGILNKLIDNFVKIDLPGGTLTIEWDSTKESPVYMTGDATYVYEGVFY